MKNYMLTSNDVEKAFDKIKNTKNLWRRQDGGVEELEIISSHESTNN